MAKSEKKKKWQEEKKQQHARVTRGIVNICNSFNMFI